MRYCWGLQFSWKFLSALLYICATQSVIFVFTQTSLKPPQKHCWSSLTISNCLFGWNWKYLLLVSVIVFVVFTVFHLFALKFHLICQERAARKDILMFFPVVVPKTNQNFNRHLFLLKNWNNHAPPHLRQWIYLRFEQYLDFHESVLGNWCEGRLIAVYKHYKSTVQTLQFH